MLPNQVIPESQKTNDWAKRCCLAIVKMINTSNNAKEKDKFCYDLYNGVLNESDFDYLRKVDKYEYPAKIRFIPLLRPKMDRLRSQESERPMNIRVFTTDSVSIDKKEKEKLNAILDKIEGKYLAKQEQIQSILNAINQQNQQIEEAKQSGQEIPPEQKQQMEQMQMQLRLAVAPINRADALTKKEIEELDKFYRYEYKDILEEISEKGLKYLVSKYNIREVFNDGFEDKLCTDKEIYYVNYHPGDEDPQLRRVNTLNFYYSGDDEASMIGDCEWCVEERWLTVNQIIDEFRAELEPEDLEKIKKMNLFDSDSFGPSLYNSTSEQGDGCSNELYSGTMNYANKVRVCYTFWQSPRKLNIKKSPNKHNPNLSFTHMINDEETTKLRAGEEVEAKYVNDIWEGVVINNQVFVRLKKSDIQLRSIDKYGKVQLPYVGKAFNGINKKPYSLMWAAKDIQILYNIIHYHKELMLALSGVRGFIMDKAQIPDGMSQEEWIYQRKLGIGWIQSVKEGIQKQPSYNQFQSFDDSISSSVQFLIGILQHLEELAGNVTGISRQRMGDITNQDLKGTTDASIQQSSMVTEILYYQHDQIKRHALQRLINLTKIAWKDGKRGQYVIGDFAQEILNIPAGTIDKADYEVFMSNSSKEEKLMERFRGLAEIAHKEGTVNIAGLAKLYTIDSLKEMEKSLEKLVDVAEQKAQASNQDAQEFEMQKLQAEQEFQKAMKATEQQASMLDSQIKQAALEFEKGKWAEEQAMRKDELNQNISIQKYKIDEDTKMEEKYLQEQKSEAAQDFALTKIELGLKGISETLSKVSDNVNKKEKAIKQKVKS